MNMSQWVYDVGGGGDYIEAAISSLGISDEQLLQNLAQRLSKKIKDTTTVPWPPHIDHLEEGEEVYDKSTEKRTSALHGHGIAGDDPTNRGIA
ncbi:hypothetical protein JOQ06_009793 [Pogonophryne albipinna]|uniref:Uncharacterized protein n=1 Tax=Pogonophryne albipinna TaxID=1090488 RepID=A0AAD6FW56_9TELE|nr:hypothetical protein JOQ06_009793 [Pogonophryne albipinna]